MTDPKEHKEISDRAVKAKTGKTWQEWFELLDAANAADMSHADIVKYLTKAHMVTAWWRQSIAGTYERARGLRVRHQMPNGFQISCSKTCAVSLDLLYQAWLDERFRAKWMLHPEWVLRKATEAKSMRITWIDGRSNLDVYFYEKGPGKSQVVVNHNRLADEDEATRMKEYWREQLLRLKNLLTAS